MKQDNFDEDEIRYEDVDNSEDNIWLEDESEVDMPERFANQVVPDESKPEPVNKVFRTDANVDRSDSPKLPFNSLSMSPLRPNIPKGKAFSPSGTVLPGTGSAANYNQNDRSNKSRSDSTSPDQSGAIAANQSHLLTKGIRNQKNENEILQTTRHMNKHVSTRQPGIEDSEPMFAPQPDKKFKKSDQFKEHDEALEVRIRTETNLPEWYVLDDLIENHHPLPQGSMILGVDPDGKPLVLSLEDSSFGSMLFLGDDEAFNRKHLMSVLSSAESLNPPDLLQIDVISPNPAGFQTEKSQVRKICDVSDDCAFTILGDLLSEIEDRIREHRQLPFQIIVIDQIELLVARLAEESLRYLRWILRRGPQAGIWPMATLSSDQLPQFDLKTYKSFGFHLYGKMTSVDSINKFCRVSPKVLMSLSPGSQGCFLIESDLISFSIPEIAH